jgi:hypothetical protein
MHNLKENLLKTKELIKYEMSQDITMSAQKVQDSKIVCNGVEVVIYNE